LLTVSNGILYQPALTNRVAIVVALLVLELPAAHAVSRERQDDLRLAFRSADSLCRDLSSSSELAGAARRHLRVASRRLLAAEQRAHARQYSSALDRARKALRRMVAAGIADKAVQWQLFVERLYVGSAVYTFVETAIEEARPAHQSEAAFATILLREGSARQEAGDVKTAVTYYRRAAKQVLGFVQL
jgi:hypothetical protein